ncbi:hypothetical protein IIA15_09180 [candidate division TA06 bacterium]|nr:hypothetical protein [candidate division TA06 bacterium]
MHQSRQAGGLLDDAKAFYAAQAGLRKGIWRLLYDDPPENWALNDGIWPKNEPPALLDTGDGINATYQVTVSCLPGSDCVNDVVFNIRIVASGAVHGISRTVQRDYEADLKNVVNLNDDTLTPILNSWQET